MVCTICDMTLRKHLEKDTIGSYIMTYKANIMAGILLVAVVLLGGIFLAAASANLNLNTPNVKPGDNPVFNIKVTNAGETILNPVKVVDTLPECLSYVSDDRNGHAAGNEITWENVGPLDIGEATEINIVTNVEDCASGKLTNLANIIGTPPTGYPVSGEDLQEINVLKCCQAKGQNTDRLDIGGQKARSFGHASSANYIEVLKNQDSDKCSSELNQYVIKLMSQTAYANGRGQAVNHIKISLTGKRSPDLRKTLPVPV